MFCTPAYGNIGFKNACDDGAVEGVYAKGCEFEAEGCLGAAGSGNCVEEDHCTYRKEVRTAHHDHRWNSGRDELRDIRIYADDGFREDAEQESDADDDAV